MSHPGAVVIREGGGPVTTRIRPRDHRPLKYIRGTAMGL